MPKAPVAPRSPKIKKLAVKARQSPNMLTTKETRKFGASMMAHLISAKEGSSVAAKKTSAK